MWGRGKDNGNAVKILKKYLNNNYKGFAFSPRWVRERNEVAKLGRGILTDDIDIYIHDDKNYVVNGLKP